MQRIRAAAAGFIAAAVVVAATGTPGATDGQGQLRQRPCGLATLRGTYGIQIEGTRPFGNEVESVIGVVLRTSDGRGQFTQVDNVKGSKSGTVPDRPGFGTYEVDPDCSATARLQPGPNIFIVERIIIVDDSNELRGITAEPAGVMVSSVHRRLRSR
jgi:hypothetical protein